MFYFIYYYNFFLVGVLLASLLERLVMYECTRIPLPRVWKIDHQILTKDKKVTEFVTFW